jgi:hypothetical protein
LFEDSSRERCALAILRRLPALAGTPVRIQNARGLRDRRGAVHAGAFVRERRIAFDCSRAEFPRIFAHELAHFLWFRLGNPARRSYETLVRGELRERAPGELGWSAEWRKRGLRAGDLQGRSRRWREYCCESFCDTAAWLYSGVKRHEEFTLAGRFRSRRRTWFAGRMGARRLSI